jgi:DNA-binding response OmpR family regulator
MVGMRPLRVLVVDDEVAIRDIVRRYLEAAGLDVAEAADGQDALTRFASVEPDLVVLDLMMPGMDGLEVLRSLRATSDVYVILLTAKADEVDKLVGLSVGADDYLTKPFSPRELAARVRAVLRRRRDAPRSRPNGEVLGFEGLVIDTGRREVRRGGNDVELTALEFDLLAALAESPGRVYSRRRHGPSSHPEGRRTPDPRGRPPPTGARWPLGRMWDIDCSAPDRPAPKVLEALETCGPADPAAIASWGSRAAPPRPITSVASPGHGLPAGLKARGTWTGSSRPTRDTRSLPRVLRLCRAFYAAEHPARGARSARH